MLSIGVEVAETHVRGGLVAEDGQVLHRHREASPSSPEDLATAVAATVEALRPEGGSTPVGIAFAGDAHRSAPGAPDPGQHEDLRLSRLAERLSGPVHAEKSANAAAWAEHRFGALVGQDDGLTIILGTTMDAGFILGGRLVRGAHGMGGRIGHMPLVPGGAPCPCGLRGCFEQYASGSALVQRTREALADTASATGGIIERLGNQPSALTSEDIIQAALTGDELAVEQISVIGSHLGQGVARFVLAFDLSTIVLGGPLAAAGELLLGPTREAMSRHLPRHGWQRPPEFRLGLLGDDAAPVGAAELARRPSEGS